MKKDLVQRLLESQAKKEEAGLAREVSTSVKQSPDVSSDSSVLTENERTSCFTGLKTVEDVDEYGRITQNQVSQRSELSVITTFSADNQQIKAKVLTLSGLLEYTKKDMREKIFEVSLLGEVFKDMLMYRFGNSIGEVLRQAEIQIKAEQAAQEAVAKELQAESLKESSKVKDDTTDDSARSTTEPAKETSDKVLSENVKDASMDTSKNDAMSGAEETGVDNVKDTVKDPSKDTSKGTKKEVTKEIAGRKSPLISIDRELFIACRYFDTKNRGELSQDQLMHILLNSRSVCCKTEGERLIMAVLDREPLRYRKLYKNSYVC